MKHCWWLGLVLVVMTACSSKSGEAAGKDASAMPDGADSATPTDSPTPSGTGSPGVQATVVIKEPTGLEAFTTLDSHIVVSGFTFGPIDAVTWANDRGGSGQATGTATWQADVPLEPGRNVVTVHATGPGADASETLIVQRNGSVQFAGLLELDPPGVLVGTSTSVRVHIALAPTAGFKADSVRVVRVAADGTQTPVAPLYDDGDVNHGDEVQGDHVYGGLLALSEPTPGVVRLRAVADSTAGSPEVSPDATLFAVAPLTEAQIGAMQTRHGAAKTAFETAMAAGQTRAEAVAAAETELQQDPDVLVVDHAPGGTGILVVWKHGVLGTLSFPEPGTRAGPGSASAAVGTVQDEVGNHDAILVAPFADEFKSLDDTVAIAPLLQTATCPKYTVAPPVHNGAVTFELMRTIGKYGVVAFSSHGDSFEESKLKNQAIDPNDPALQTLGMLGLGTNKPNTRDVLFLRGGADPGTLSKPNVQLALRMGSLTLGVGDLGVTAGFFRRWVAPMQHNLVYLGACRSLRNGDLGKAILGRGAAAVVGYTDYVRNDWASGQAKQLFSCLLKGTGLEPNVKPTTHTCYVPASDPVKHGALQLLPADSDLSLHGAEFRNGGFEEELLGWTGSGDARTIVTFGGNSPTEGKSMALVSTGLGFTTTSGALTQTFCLPDDVKTVAFDWQFVSAEFKTYCNSTFQDTLLVKFGKVGAPATLLTRTVDNLCASVTEAAVLIPQSGDPDGAWTSGWQHATGLDVSEFAGQSDVELVLSVTDVGDSAYDTVILIDNVVFSK